MHRFFLFLCLISLLLWACINTQKTSNNAAPSILSDEYYQALPNTADRLHHLLTGTFVQYQRDPQQGNKMVTWHINDKGDSVLYNSLRFGDPNKDGYWIYHCQRITSLPDKPLHEYFEHIVKISRDSFCGNGYPMLPDKSYVAALENPDMLKEIDTKEVRKADISSKTIYEKLTNSTFIARSEFYPYKLKVKGQDALVQDVLTVTPTGEMTSCYYTTLAGEPLDTFDIFLKRAIPEKAKQTKKQN